MLAQKPTAAVRFPLNATQALEYLWACQVDSYRFCMGPSAVQDGSCGYRGSDVPKVTQPGAPNRCEFGGTVCVLIVGPFLPPFFSHLFSQNRSTVPKLLS